MLDLKFKTPLIEDLCRLIRIPSRSSAAGGEEGEFQQVVARRMRSLGAHVRAFTPDDVPGFRQHPLCCGPTRNYHGRLTVIGELGPEDAPALLLMAHSDTVPIIRHEDWTFSPFLGEVRDGMVCGLGSNDDKSGTAFMLTVMRALVDSGKPLSKRLIFASTIDEENGVGNGLLLLMLAGIRAEAAIYLDGREMNVCIGNSGGSNLYLRPTLPIGDAVLQDHAARLKSACAELSRRRRPLFARPFFEQSDVRDESVMFYRREDERGPFFLVAFYTVPGEIRESVVRDLEAMVSGALGNDFAAYTASYRQPWFEPALISDQLPIVRMVAQSVAAVRGNPLVTVITKQDAFVMNVHAGIPTVSFGVGRPDGAGGPHHPNECISVEDVWTGCCVVWEAVQRWLE